MRLLIGLLSAGLALSPALADSAFVAPTSNGTAAVGQLPGTTTNDSAASGKVGELLSYTSSTTSSVSLTTTTGTNVTSGSFTAGDWDVTCTVYFSFGATTTVQRLQAGPSPTSATLDTTVGHFSEQQFPSTVIGSAGFTTITSAPVRVPLASTSTLYCVGLAIFGVSTAAAGAELRGRRVR